jgi:hypothetical protein
MEVSISGSLEGCKLIKGKVLWFCHKSKEIENER